MNGTKMTNGEIEKATALMQAAEKKLVDGGVETASAKALVNANFKRVNADARLVLTLDELCKPYSVSGD